MTPLLFRYLYLGNKGFSLIEIILSLVILSTGIISVQKAFISSVSALSVIENWDQAESLLEGKIWEIQRAMKEKMDFTLLPFSQGKLVGRRRTYPYELNIEPIDSSANLMEAKISVFWEISGKRRFVTRNFYLMVPYGRWKNEGRI